MAAKVTIVLDAPGDVLGASPYGAGALIRLERASSEAGAYSEIATIAVLAETYLYEHWDAGGDATSWYRWRLSNSANTETGDYSAPLTGEDPAVAARQAGSYATLDDLLLAVGHVPQAGSRELARMQRALVDATDKLIDEIGFDFFRHPATGTEVRLVDGTGDGRLHVHEGIVSLSAVRIKESASASFVAVNSADYLLSPAVPRSGWPYDHVDFTGVGTYGIWPRVKRGVELTGVFGWPRVPRAVINANIAWARQDLAADPSFPGGIVGPEELGSPSGPNRLPDAVWRLKRAMSRAHWCDL